MRPPRLTVIFVLLLTATLTFADKVTTDFDHSVDFSKYRTFMWIQNPNVQEPLMQDRIMKAVNAQLNMRGLQEVSEGGDLAIGANLTTEEKQRWDTYYTGDGGWGWGWGGGGWATTTVETYEVGTLSVDLFDARTKKMVWQGVGVDTLSHKPEKRVKDFNKQIGKMFREFPVYGIYQGAQGARCTSH